MRSKNIKSAAFPSQMHDFDLQGGGGGGSSFEVQVKIMFSALKFLWYTQFDFEQEGRELKSLICFCTVSLFALFVRKKFW